MSTEVTATLSLAGEPVEDEDYFFYCYPCTGPALQIRAATPTQLFGLSQGRNMTSHLSNGLALC